ncbi:MAG: DotU family type IV/VI secretion system protein [Candidatus Eisenbacteria bacterium]
MRRPGRDPHDTRGRSRRSSAGADETVIFDPPPRGGGRSGKGGKRCRGDAGDGGGVRLVDLCSDWLSMVVALRQAPSPNLDANLIRTRALELKARLEQDGARSRVNPVDVEAASFALIAFLDESAIRAGGALRDAWFQRPLQLELFGTNRAGEEFFTRLDGLRRDREARIEALEVYACCLAFGFQGQMGMAGPERVKAVLTEVDNDIAAVRGTGRRPLAPHAARPDDAGGNITGKFPIWLALAVFVPALVLTWLVVKLIAVFGANGARNAIARLLGGDS